MKFSISLPNDVGTAVLERMYRERAKNPKETISLSGIITDLLRKAMKDAECEVKC